MPAGVIDGVFPVMGVEAAKDPAHGGLACSTVPSTSIVRRGTATSWSAVTTWAWLSCRQRGEGGLRELAQLVAHGAGRRDLVHRHARWRFWKCFHRLSRAEHRWNHKRVPDLLAVLQQIRYPASGPQAFSG
ncbi:MAG TPA: hypothetical protein VKK81_26145 [Candidatus Binatia bacterium]|nr:hypothetical protein [Candidatus Binatia bacterium]